MEYELKKRIDAVCFKLMETPIEYCVTQEKDKSLKSLFEVKRQFIQLIKTFVKEEWVEKLTEENVELADKDFIIPNIHEVKADLIYRIKSEDIYFILLEFQSTEDKNMPYRLLSYIVEIWRRYGKNGKLPVVIPCVLYTGNTKWKVKTLRNLFDVSCEVEKYIPDFDYILIDVNRYSDEELLDTANLVTSVVYMAKSKDKIEVADKLRNIIALLSKMDKKEQESFVKWAEVMFYNEGSVVYDYFEENLNKEEKKDMALADLIPGAIEIFKDEGRVEGRLEGKIEGKIEGKRSLIIKMLTKKLGEQASEEILQVIENIPMEKIEKIADNIFEIASWSEVEELIN